MNRAPRRRRALTTAAALVITLAACTSQNDYAGPADADTVDPMKSISFISEDDRRRVGDFEGSTLGGRTVDASSLEDVVTVVNVWGSWCGPCRVEAPALREVAEQYKDRGVRFLGLNVRDNDAGAEAFERRFEIPYDSITSADSPRVSLAFGGLLTTAAVPMTVVVDSERRVAARVVGQVSAATLRALLDDVLAESERGPMNRNPQPSGAPQ